MNNTTWPPEPNKLYTAYAFKRENFTVFLKKSMNYPIDEHFNIHSDELFLVLETDKKNCFTTILYKNKIVYIPNANFVFFKLSDE